MKNLVLIRHAKSSWDGPLVDRDRPLANRGVQDAHLVAATIHNYLPKNNLVWSSVAKRAADTAIIFAQNLLWPVESIVFKEELYTFDENQLATIIKNCSDDYENVILFGHNDAITKFVNKFGDAYVENVPTSGFVTMSFDTPQWALITKGKTVKIIFPRDLKI